MLKVKLEGSDIPVKTFKRDEVEVLRDVQNDNGNDNDNDNEIGNEILEEEEEKILEDLENN